METLVEGGIGGESQVHTLETDALQARWYLYTFFQALLGGAPDEALAQAADVDLAQEALEVLGRALGDDDRPLTLVAAYAALSTDVAAVAKEYTRCFIGPGRLPAYPWESMYVGEEKRLFSSVTLAVRNFYRSYGFLTAGYPNVADDHLAIELHFLGELAGRAASCCAGSKPAGATPAAALELLRTSYEFLDEHLGRWVFRYVDDFARHGGFYGSVMRDLATFLEADRAFLSAVVGAPA